MNIACLKLLLITIMLASHRTFLARIAVSLRLFLMARIYLDRAPVSDGVNTTARLKPDAYQALEIRKSSS